MLEVLSGAAVSESNSGKKKMKIGLLGASLEVGNLGVKALAEASTKVLLHTWPDAEIVLVGGREPNARHHLTIEGRSIELRTLPIRFCKNVLLPYHFVRYAVFAALARLLRNSAVERFLIRRNPYFACLHQLDFVADITGGDSFSDIYGLRRFVLMFLHKWLVLLAGKKLVMLPQTYGPFNRRLVRVLARYILRRCSALWSRDKQSMEYLRALLGEKLNAEKVHFCPDVAFVLDSREPPESVLSEITAIRKKHRLVVGFNISGLLYHGGYTRDNMFGLRVDYPHLVGKLLDYFMSLDNSAVILVPHVFPRDDASVESDPAACRRIFERFAPTYQGRLVMLQDRLDQGQVKYVIGQCDFFLGSRMHSCIAALSQGIPAIGLAYSRKFIGVFESLGLGHMVADMRDKDEADIISQVKEAIEARRQASEHLRKVVPQVQAMVLNLFEQTKMQCCEAASPKPASVG